MTQDPRQHDPAPYPDPYGSANPAPAAPYGVGSGAPSSGASGPYPAWETLGRPYAAAPQSAPYDEPSDFGPPGPYAPSGGFTAAPYGGPYGHAAPQPLPLAVTPYGVTVPATYSAAHPPRPAMSYGQALRAFLANYLAFHGRAGKGEFWFPALTVAATMFVLMVVHNNGWNFGGGLIGSSGEALLVLALLGSAVPSLTAAVRRLHDTGRSGFSALLALIPLVGPFILLGMLLGDSKPGGTQFDSPRGDQPSVG